MATQRRKNRISRRIASAVNNNNNKTASRLQGRLNNIATREGNRALGGSGAKKLFNKVTDPLRNAAGLPAKSLTATAGQAFTKNFYEKNKGNLGGTVQSPQSYLTSTKNKTYNKSRGISSPSVGGNSQNINLMSSNLGTETAPFLTGSQTTGTQDFGTPVKTNGGLVNDTTPDTSSEGVVAAGPATVTGGGSTTAALRVGGVASPSGSATTGTTATPSGSGLLIAPSGSEGYLNDYDYTLSNEERAQKEAYEDEQDYYEKQKNERVNREQIMRDALRQFQGEIDATNAVFANKLKQSQLAGLDRLGMSRAENFNAGAVNSSFGNAALERVEQYNRDTEAAIENEKLQLISQIESSARAAGERYYQEKKAAKEAGLEAYMTSLTNAKTAKQAISNDIAYNMLSSNINIEQINPDKLASIAKSAGVTVQSIKNAFDEAKKLAEAEQIKAEQEAAKAERESQFNLSEGQARYDQYGNLIASRGKTYAPSSGGSSYGSSAGLSPLAQAVQNGTISLDKLTPTERGRVAAELSSAGVPSSRQMSLESNMAVVDALINNPNRKKISGYVQGKLGLGNLSPKGQLAINQYNQLKGILSLDNREKLKGSGAISDFEFKVLEQAASALGRNLSDAEFERQLQEIRDVFAGKYAYTRGESPTSYSSGNIVTAPDGTVVEIID